MIHVMHDCTQRRLMDSEHVRSSDVKAAASASSDDVISKAAKKALITENYLLCYIDDNSTKLWRSDIDARTR